MVGINLKTTEALTFKNKLNALNETLVYIEKDDTGKVVKVCEVVAGTQEAVSELKQQASINQNEALKQATEVATEQAKENDKKERAFNRLKVFIAYQNYFNDTEAGAIDPDTELEVQFVAYRKHESEDILNNETFKDYLKEVELND